MNKSNSNKSFFNKIWNKFKNHLMINFKTDESDQRQEAIKYVNQAFDNQDNLFIMISNGIKTKTNTKDKKMTFDEKKLAEIIVATVQPMIDKAFQKVKPMIDESLNIALEPIKKDISILKNDVSELKQDVKILKREATKHGWDLTPDKQ